MNLNRNNNNKIIYRIAKNNLLANKMSSFISMLSILLAITLVSTLTLFMVGTQTAEKRVLNGMQHVMYMNITEEQLGNLASDDKTDTCVPYKQHEQDFQTQGVKYSFSYYGSHTEEIQTYVLAEGKAPEKYKEIVVDKAFMKALGKNCSLGASIELDVGGEAEEFVVSGYTDDKYSVLTHPIRVSKDFAEQNPIMRDLPYTALVRLNKVSGMPFSVFTTSVYQMAADYGIERANVNTNGKFEQSLQSGNNGFYIVFFVSLLLFLASGIVIYSIFYFSVTSRVQQIGQFQTIGMTAKQVKKMIRREGMLLSCIAIPLGLLISGIISYITVPKGWDLKNYSIVALAIIIFGILIVQIAIGKPAVIASKISPIEAASNITGGEKEYIRSGEHKYLTPYTLARMEGKNNQKKWWLTTASLALGGIIFMFASTWISSWDEEAFSRQDVFKNSEYYISYQYDIHGSPKAYGITDMQLKGHLGTKLESDIRKIPYVKDIHIERTATGVIEHQGATFTQPFYPLTKEDTEYFQLPAEGHNSYEYMVENDAILITNSAFSENVNGITFKPGDTLKIRYFDGEEHTIELEIAAVTAADVSVNFQRSNFCMSDVTMKKLWKAMDTADSFFVSVENYEENGTQAEKEIRALINGYEDLSLWTLREQRLEDSGQVQKLKMQIYGISIFVILFSIFNLINTVISSITARKKQLSMLESIGMEERQIRNMLFAESFLVALPNILITLTIGTVAGFGFISVMQKSINYLEYQFPIVAIVLYVIGMICIPLIITLYCLKKQRKFSLVERIRNED